MDEQNISEPKKCSYIFWQNQMYLPGNAYFIARHFPQTIYRTYLSEPVMSGFRKVFLWNYGSLIKRVFLIVFVTFLLNVSVYVFGEGPVNVSQELLDEITQKYGEQAQKRILLWDKMIEENRNEKIFNKLQAVNDYFNKIKYEKDIDNWGKSDYWATPFELISVGAGDCEDYAVAKYFSLKKLGVPEEKLKITYAKYLGKAEIYEKAHMVLTYYHQPDAVPIVLDNIVLKMMLATERSDLKPIYSFNAADLVESQNKGKLNKNEEYYIQSLDELMKRM